MGHWIEPHTWEPPHEHHGATYRECSSADCGCYQEWICALDRWSDSFDAPSPRQRVRAHQQVHAGAKAPR